MTLCEGFVHQLYSLTLKAITPSCIDNASSAQWTVS